MPVRKLFDLEGQVALVSGSSRGIGHALALALADAGAKVVLNGRDAERLRAAASAMAERYPDTAMSCFDATNPEEVWNATAEIERSVGPIGILVNNAGIQKRAPLETFAVEDWRSLMRVNVEGAFLLGQAVASHMIPRRRGKIINVCSVQSELGRPGIAPYAASKGALKMLTKGMCTDWGRHNIQVNGIGPGYFETEMTASLVADETFSAWLAERTPAGRWGRVEELAGAVVFLASEASSFVNGHILYVDGGITARL
jgi:gluconate 5-dehydrogenase